VLAVRIRLEFQHFGQRYGLLEEWKIGVYRVGGIRAGGSSSFVYILAATSGMISESAKGHSVAMRGNER